MRIPGLDTRELHGRTFTCLPGCGFCCTFQPEADQRELALLRARLRPRALPVVVGDGRSYLGLHNKCGACTLLERRNCTQYDLRPQHCRYFPFHVHFGRTPEAYVNYTCRGVERLATSDLEGPFATSLLANAKDAEIADHIRGAREAYATFERNAKKSGAWGDVAEVVERALAEDPFTRGWMGSALERADEELEPEEMLADALEPFSDPDITKRPFYLAPDLKWITFDGPTRAVEMDEHGALQPLRTIPPLEGWAAPAADLRPYLRELAARGVFEGSVFALVDESDYTTTVPQATWWRLAEVVADLSVRARILALLDVPPARIAEETARFYDSTFLDADGIGGFL
ncbi:MAG TPA: YkgJ family cysteine cluster protein [Candidatus Thermoplasmatota archaeon]|nr:YkgJ family cysteine cluster protein [Candidatus Thermoplasmatota archaeon]